MSTEHREPILCRCLAVWRLRTHVHLPGDERLAWVHPFTHDKIVSVIVEGKNSIDFKRIDFDLEENENTTEQRVNEILLLACRILMG